MTETAADLCIVQHNVYAAFINRMKDEGVKDSETIRMILNGDVHLRPLPITNIVSHDDSMRHLNVEERCHRTEQYNEFERSAPRQERAQLLQLSFQNYRAFVLTLSQSLDPRGIADCCDAFGLGLPVDDFTVRWALLQAIDAPNYYVKQLILTEVQSELQGYPCVVCLRLSRTPCLDVCPVPDVWPAGTHILAYRTTR